MVKLLYIKYIYKEREREREVGVWLFLYLWVMWVNCKVCGVIKVLENGGFLLDVVCCSSDFNFFGVGFWLVYIIIDLIVYKFYKLMLNYWIILNF